MWVYFAYILHIFYIYFSSIICSIFYIFSVYHIYFTYIKIYDNIHHIYVTYMSVTYMLHICPHIYAIYVVAYMAYMVHICSFLYAAYMSFPYGITYLLTYLLTYWTRLCDFSKNMNWLHDGAFRLYLSPSINSIWRPENRKCFEISVNTSYLCLYYNYKWNFNGYPYIFDYA